MEFRIGNIRGARLRIQRLKMIHCVRIQLFCLLLSSNDRLGREVQRNQVPGKSGQHLRSQPVEANSPIDISVLVTPDYKYCTFELGQDIGISKGHHEQLCTVQEAVLCHPTPSIASPRPTRYEWQVELGSRIHLWRSMGKPIARIRISRLL